jgi:hypothetical protein
MIHHNQLSFISDDDVPLHPLDTSVTRQLVSARCVWKRATRTLRKPSHSGPAHCASLRTAAPHVARTAAPAIVSLSAPSSPARCDICDASSSGLTIAATAAPPSHVTRGSAGAPTTPWLEMHFGRRVGRNERGSAAGEDHHAAEQANCRASGWPCR